MGGSLLDNKINATMTKHNYGADFLHSLDTNALILFDAGSAAALASSVLSSFRSDNLKSMAMLLIVDREVFRSRVMLDRMNLTIRSYWRAGLVVMKPN